jgi:hypothetical protein
LPNIPSETCAKSTNIVLIALFYFVEVLIFSHSGGIALTSFTIKYGLVPVVFSMAVTHGVAFGLIYAQAIGAVIKWFLKDNKG